MIAVIDYGMGNLRSVQKGLQRVGGDAQIVSAAGELQQAEKIVLPGVGAFGDAIERLKSTGMVPPLMDAIRAGTPFLGICLGFQLLFDISYEDGEFTGLGVLPGKVVHFDFPESLSGQNLKVPHMGWNQIRFREACPLFKGIEQDAYVYFVHSYHVVTIRDDVVAATTDYGYPFTSAVWSKNIFATQFHPEKSQDVGLRMLENFVEL